MWSRRAFLRATVVTAGTVLTGVHCAGSESPPEDGAEFFTCSVASGDPRPDGVVLWTRVHDSDGPETIEVLLELAKDPDFAERIVLDDGPQRLFEARASDDYCIKAKIEGLEPFTTYHYRFLYDKGGTTYSSPTGTTKTAPDPDSDQPIRFAFVSCQDYEGRYFNVHAFLAEQDIDFVVHLGDYVYETAGDPSFQTGDSERRIEFDDEEGALQLGDGDEVFWAARSLDNYRQLYRTYRMDRALQRVHERFPMIAIWDDHEFADDCHGATSTHFAGRRDEIDEDRRKNASQAWYEYMPADVGDYDPSVDFPDDSRIWRDLRFGRHLHLILTDLRTRRIDHPVAEDAYPGTIVIEEGQLLARELAMIDTVPYVDIETFEDGTYLAPLQEAAQADDYDTDRIVGNISVPWIHRVLEAIGSSVPPIDEAVQAGLPRGYAVMDLGKTSLFTRLGSRYLVSKSVYDLYASLRFEESDGDSEQIMGSEQEAWFLETMEDSPCTWKVWANEFCLVPLQIDLSPLPIDPAFRKQFYMSLDGWDGGRSRRDQILQTLGGIDNVVAITGDVHAFFAGVPSPAGDPDRNIIELVVSSLSSQTYRDVLSGQVNTTDLKDVPGASDLAAAIDNLLTLSSGPNPHLAFSDSTRHGIAVVDIDEDRLEATYFMADADVVDEEAYDDDLSDRFRTVRFRVQSGDKSLQWDDGGTWRRWDPAERSWV